VFVLQVFAPNMERVAFTLLHESERSWWYRGRAKVVESVTRALGSSLSILDFGAGYGGMERTLSVHGTVSAFEPDAEARMNAKNRAYASVYDSMEEALAHSYDALALFDVLEHIEDDSAFLRRAHDSLREKGKLVLTIPAMPFLWSAHDVAHHHYRRYTKQTLTKVLIDAGFSIEKVSYWNMFLFFPAALARLLGKSGESSFHLPPILDHLFYALIWIEALCIRYFSLPFGVSLVAIARKK
jgi:SAM-dependent methyltransferase